FLLDRPGRIAALAAQAGFDFDQFQRQPVRQALAVFAESIRDPGRRTLADGDQARLQDAGPVRGRRRRRTRITQVSHPPRGGPEACVGDKPRLAAVQRLRPRPPVRLARVFVRGFGLCVRGWLVTDRPQALERVELAHARQHHVDHDVAQVDQHPFGLAFALDAERLAAELLGLAHHLVGDRLDVARRGARGDHHVVADAGPAAYVDFGDVLGLEVPDRGVDAAEQHFGGRRRVGKTGLDDVRGTGQGRWLWRLRHDYTGPGVSAP